MAVTVKGACVRVYSSPVTVYGIPNCDQVKKACAWLDAHQIEYVFHDIKKPGLRRELAGQWLEQIDPGILINRKGTTWRTIDDARKALVDKASGQMAEKITLLLEYPSVIKRPVLDVNGAITIGFNADHYTSLFT